MILQPPPARPEARNRRLRQWFIAVSAAVVITVAVLVMLGFVQLSAARADWSEALEESGEARMTADITATFWHEHEAGLAYLSQPSPAGLRLPAAGAADRTVGGTASSLPAGRTALARSLPAATSPALSRWPAHCRHGAGPRRSRGTVRC